MEKYTSPTIEIVQCEASDVISSSSAVSYAPLEGVDKGDDKSAIFSADFWIRR